MENEQEVPKILGTLFGSINYDSEENLSKFIDDINSAQAAYCIQQALTFAHICAIRLSNRVSIDEDIGDIN